MDISFTLDGDQNDSFGIGYRNGTLYTVKGLDYETVQQVSLTVSVEDCSISMNMTEVCDDVHSKPPGPQTQAVKVNIMDKNDHPPKFKEKEIIFGMKRVTQVATVLEVSLKVYSHIQIS